MKFVVECDNTYFVRSRNLLSELQKSCKIGVDISWGDHDKARSTIKDSIWLFNDKLADDLKSKQKKSSKYKNKMANPLIYGSGSSHIWIADKETKERLAIVYL